MRGLLRLGERTTLQEIRNLLETIARGDLAPTKYMPVTVRFDRLAKDPGETMVATGTGDHDRKAHTPDSANAPLPDECRHR